ncbi:hypothetical protein [Saccharothrix deserti]|uniref:hypothetical protein n=1 Tax=Saccharothrix deserti TaxID=2593674 RepID=UPI00131E841F|nr:hypothetical protein [Saccharothrix deserti]
MTGGDDNAEQEFWDQFDRAFRRAGSPPFKRISKEALEKYDIDIPESTVREWVSNRRLPRAPDKLVPVMRVLGAEQQCDWVGLLDRANTARRLSDRPAGAPPDTDAPPETTAPPQVPATTDTTATTSTPATSDATGPMPPRGRRITGWLAAGVAAAVTMVVFVLASSGEQDAPHDGSTASATVTGTSDGRGASTQPTKDEDGGVPCRPPASSGFLVPTAQASPRPTAYAPGGAGHAELVLDQRRVVLTDDLGDGCSIILTVRADGAEAGTWPNSAGRTGKIKDGVPIPPKTIDLPWLDTARRIDFRVCVGEVVNRKPVFREDDCGPWVTANR